MKGVCGTGSDAVGDLLEGENREMLRSRRARGIIVLKRKRLSPLEADVLAQLEDAGEEELETLINCLARAGVSYPARRDVLPSACDALRGLFELGAIQFALPTRPGFAVLSAERTQALLELERWLVWETNGEYWRASGEFAEVQVLQTDVRD